MKASNSTVFIDFLGRYVLKPSLIGDIGLRALLYFIMLLVVFTELEIRLLFWVFCTLRLAAISSLPTKMYASVGELEGGFERQLV